MIEYIDIDHPEINAIWDQLPDLALALRNRLLAKGMEPLPHKDLLDNVQAHIVGHGEDYTIITAGPCIVGYNTVQPWWSRYRVLAEEFIVRYKAGNFADTISELEAHAKAQGCEALVISSLVMTRKESYGHYLKRKGFREVSREYAKEV